MRTDVNNKSNNGSKVSNLDAEEEFLEFISGVEGEIERIGSELGADFRFEIAPPESIDGDSISPNDLSFFVTLRKDDFPALSYCLYTRLESQALRAFAGQYDAGKVTTIKELSPLYSFDATVKALKGWLSELFWLSLGRRSDSA